MAWSSYGKSSSRSSRSTDRSASSPSPTPPIVIKPAADPTAGPDARAESRAEGRGMRQRRTSRRRQYRPRRQKEADHVTTTFAFVGMRLVDGRGGDPIDDAVIVAEGERLVSVGPAGSAKVPRDAR